MDINSISLPGSVLATLYPNTLVETGETQPGSPELGVRPTATEPANTTWKWLGENQKRILVAVHYTNAVHIPDNELQFLTKMLSACALSLADVAIVNISNQPHDTYKEILPQFNSKVALLFDIEPAAFGLPMNFPFFQIQPFATCSFLYAPALSILESDQVQKSKLWVSLRRLFNI